MAIAVQENYLPISSAPPTRVAPETADDAGVPAVMAVARFREAGGIQTGFTDIVEEWGMQSFPASDPPANW